QKSFSVVLPIVVQALSVEPAIKERIELSARSLCLYRINSLDPGNNLRQECFSLLLMLFDRSRILHAIHQMAHHCDIRSMKCAVARTRGERSHARCLYIPVETAMPTGKGLVSAAIAGLGRVEQRDHKPGRLLASANPTSGLNVLGNRLRLSVDDH